MEDALNDEADNLRYPEYVEDAGDQDDVEPDSIEDQIVESDDTDYAEDLAGDHSDTAASNLDENEFETGEPEDPTPDYFIEPESMGARVAKTSHWGWRAAAFGLVILAAVELLYWQPAALKKQVWFQDLTAEICANLPCNANPYVRIEDIDVAGLIDTNDDLSGMLTAHIELVNRSNVRQGFPNILIEFMDIRGKTTASRVLKPEDYLKGPARDLKYIPPSRPVRITLNFVDPGKSSSSHVISVLPPTY